MRLIARDESQIAIEYREAEIECIEPRSQHWLKLAAVVRARLRCLRCSLGHRQTPFTSLGRTACCGGGFGGLDYAVSGHLADDIC